jgi:capsular exopolysaccharide synthesis family protein
MDIWYLLRILRARRETLGLATLFFVGLGLAAGMYQRPVYLATSLVLIEPKRPRIASGEEVFDPNQNTGTLLLDYYRTEYEIIKSRTILEPVALALGIAEREEFRNSRDPVADFGETVKAEPVRDSRLVRVSVASRSPEFAAEATDAIVNRFMDENAGRLSGVNDAGLGKLRVLAREFKPVYEKAVADVEVFKQENDLYVPGVLTPESQLAEFQQLKALTEQLTVARAHRSQINADLGALVASADSGTPTAPQSGAATRSVFEEILVERSHLESELKELRAFYKEGHPEVRSAELRLAAAELQLKAEMGRTIRRLKMEADAAAAQEKSLLAASEAAGRAAGVTAQRASRLKVLGDEATTLSDTYKAVTKRLGELEIQSVTGAKDQNIFVIDRARTSPTPIKPNKSLFLGMGLGVGLGAGLALCLLAEFLDKRVKSRDDLALLLNLPTLGFVPRVHSANWREAPVPELESMYSPRSGFAESVRTIRTGLTFSMPADAPRAVLVTSAEPLDGKTTVSINLAITLAQAGHRVLLVDANFRTPKLHDFFEVEVADVGLSTTLAHGEALTLNAVSATKFPYLDILPAGPTPPNPAELLGSDATRDLLDLALTTYDWVIVDAPPVLVADPAILLTYIPYYVFVARLFATTKLSVTRARDILERTPARGIGLVVNTADVPKNLESSDHYGPGVTRVSRSRAAGALAKGPAHATTRLFVLLALLCAGASAFLLVAYGRGLTALTESALRAKIASDPPVFAVAAVLALVAVSLVFMSFVSYTQGVAASRVSRANHMRDFTSPAAPALLAFGGARRLSMPARAEFSRPALQRGVPPGLAPAAAVAGGTPAIGYTPETIPTVTEIRPLASAPDRSITQVTISGRCLDQVVGVSLKDTPCVLHPQADASRIVVSVPVYLIQDGHWHFVLKTPRGDVTSSAPFSILPPPVPVVTLVRPTEVQHSATEPPTLEIEGRHFTRLDKVRLVDLTGASLCTISQQPDPEPNDQRILVRLAADVRPGSYRVVVDTRSGTSVAGPSLSVLPDLVDTIEDLRHRLYRKLKLGNLEPSLKEKLEKLLWDGLDADATSLDAMRVAKFTATVVPEELKDLHDDVAKILGIERARVLIGELRQKCPDWIGEVAELCMARFVADMEPRVRAPSPAEIEGYKQAAASAFRLLRIGEAFVFDSARTKRLRSSFDTVLALCRDKELAHVADKIADHIAAVVGVSLVAESADSA